MSRILSNKARCTNCDTIIESKHAHDFKWCSCHSIFVDGGRHYIKRGGDFEKLEELSVFDEDDTQDPLERAVQQANLRCTPMDAGLDATAKAHGCKTIDDVAAKVSAYLANDKLPTTGVKLEMRAYRRLAARYRRERDDEHHARLAVEAKLAALRKLASAAVNEWRDKQQGNTNVYVAAVASRDHEATAARMKMIDSSLDTETRLAAAIRCADLNEIGRDRAEAKLTAAQVCGHDHCYSVETMKAVVKERDNLQAKLAAIEDEVVVAARAAVIAAKGLEEKLAAVTAERDQLVADAAKAEAGFQEYMTLQRKIHHAEVARLTSPKRSLVIDLVETRVDGTASIRVHGPAEDLGEALNNRIKAGAYNPFWT